MEAPTNLWSWTSAIAVSIIASLSAILGYFYKHRKLPSEIHKTDAETEFTLAQTEALKFKTGLSAVEMFEEMAADLGEARYTIIQLREEVRIKTERNRILEAEVQRFNAERTIERLGGDTAPLD